MSDDVQKDAHQAAKEVATDQINKMLANPQWGPGNENHRALLITYATQRIGQRMEEWHANYRSDLVHCWLRAERHDGNDPIEAMIWLRHKPVKGETLEVWVNEAGFRNSPRPGNTEDHARGFSYAGETCWLNVDQVVHSTTDPRTLEVWVSMEGYDLGELEKVLEAVKRGDRP